MKILGLSAFYHDSAAAIIVDGEIIAAAQEERFTRKKFDPAFPSQSIQFCLNKANLKLSDLDEIVYYEKPLLSFERLIETIVDTAPKSLFTFLGAMPIWMREKLNTRGTLQRHFKRNYPTQKIPPITFSQHHLSHAASAFYPSPFNKSAILCLDGVGEWATTSAWVGNENSIESLWELRFPHSLGLLYSAFTSFCGFKVNSGEYKLMGLAPYGKPVYASTIKKYLIDIKEDGSFRLNQKYFSYSYRFKMVNKKFEQLFGVAPRKSESHSMDQIYKDLAASIQQVTEEVVLKLALSIKKQTQLDNLCLAGGVALNCVANGALARSKIFKNIWVQPAAGDSGGALGAALASYYLNHKKIRTPDYTDSMKKSLLGPSYKDSDIEECLTRHSIPFTKLESYDLIQQICQDIEDQKVVGWFQDAMEYGPRALGSRSILGDPRNPEMQSKMNQKIKFRESFRPFAPMVIEKEIESIYQDSYADPYMLFVSHIKSDHKDLYPAVTHSDGSSRIQKVINDGSLISDLLQEFFKKTGCPLLINTSFNVRGEPIVCSPFEALRCFIKTDIDSLAIGSFYITKNNLNLNRADKKWEVSYELD